MKPSFLAFLIIIGTTTIYAQPVNDNFASATSLIHSANNCSVDAAYTTINATADLNAGSCWENGPNYNVWFTFVATSNEVTLDLKVAGTEGSMRHPNMALWQSDGTTEVACVRRVNGTTDVQISTASLTFGNTYYVSVDNFIGLGYQGTFTLCIDNTVTYDDYNGAITIVHSANNCSADAAYTTINATADLNAGSCWENGPNYNRWFTFVATGANVTLDLKVGGAEGSMRHPNMALWEADGTTQVACVRRINATTDVQISSSSLTISDTYYVSVDNFVGLGYRGTFTLCIDNTVTYDDYNGAITIVHSANNCSTDAEYSTINATADLNAGSCWENGPNYNRWFTFVATGANVTLDLKVGGAEGTMRHPNMALWEADGTTQVACVRRINGTTDVQISTPSLIIGNTYYVSVDNFVGLGYRGTFTLCIDNTVTYDDYNGAILLTDISNWCSADAAYTTINATADLNAGSCWENGPNYNRWFTFVATTNYITLDLKVGGSEGTMRHPNMALWEADGTTQVACVRRINGTTDVQISTPNLIIGNTYYISVDNFVGLAYRGTFSLCADSNPSYDYYEGAIELTDLNNWCSINAEFTTINATSDLNTGSCWENGANYNRWFRFTAISPNVTVQMNVAGAEGSLRHPNMALWANDGITELACVRRINATTDISLSYGSLVVGQTYYISADNFVGLGYRGSFTLCVNNIDGTYYSRADGNWTNPNTWSTVGFGGAAASDYPQVGDIANIEDNAVTITSNEVAAEVNITVSANNAGLTISNGSLNVAGNFTATNSGSNLNISYTYTNSSLTINNDFIIDRNGGNANISSTASGLTLTVNNNFIVNSLAGIGSHTFNFNTLSNVIIGNDLILNNAGGPKTTLTFNSSDATINNNLVFTAGADNLVEFDIENGANLFLQNNIMQGSPAYGILASTGGSTVHYNSAINLQTMVSTSGSGSGDVINYENLTINNSRLTSPQVTLGGAVTLTGLLTLANGEVLSTSTNLLTLTNTASTTGASIASFVDGPMMKTGNTPFEFPVGGNNFWQPIAIANLTGDPATEFTAEYLEQTPPDYLNLMTSDPNGDLNNISGLEHWNLANTGTVSNADVTLFWKDQTRSDIDDAADLQIAHYTGTEWENLGQDAISFADPGSITVNGVSSFSPFSFGSLSPSVNALPVELLSFNARELDFRIELMWKTASEINNDFFEIQKSPDGELFKKIGQIAGNGTSTQMQSYTFSDFSPVKGIQYYRLKQVDFNGDFEYSSTIILKYSLEIANQLPILYPNPTTGQYINLVAPPEEEVITMLVYDKKGVGIKVQYQVTTNNQYIIVLNGVPKGINVLKIITDKAIYHKKFINY
ncbi:MAG: T9SS type A sorting domain-containing protein [Cyclobacteriaceae bacterium]|nr:T9SS type A sorting domain-containing protein [Cyclobacteriaceae bacterium]